MHDMLSVLAVDEVEMRMCGVPSVKRPQGKAPPSAMPSATLSPPPKPSQVALAVKPSTALAAAPKTAAVAGFAFGALHGIAWKFWSKRMRG